MSPETSARQTLRREHGSAGSAGAPPSRRQVYVQALRTRSFTASVVPLLLGAALAGRDPGHVRWELLPVVLLAGVLFHAGTNVINDYGDWRHGVDQDYAHEGSSGILTGGLMTERAVLRYGQALFGAGVLLGLLLVAVRGWPLVVLGAVGLLGGYGYSGGPRGYKYVALGDAFVFVLMGPVMVLGSYVSLTGHLRWGPAAASVPVGCLVAAILVANNLRDVAHDRVSDVTTVTTLLPPAAAKAEYLGLLAAAYVSSVVLALTGPLPVGSLVVLLSLPLAVKAVRQLRPAELGRPEQLGPLLPETAGLHMVFGVLLVASVAVAALAH